MPGPAFFNIPGCDIVLNRSDMADLVVKVIAVRWLDHRYHSVHLLDDNSRLHFKFHLVLILTRDDVDSMRMPGTCNSMAAWLLPPRCLVELAILVLLTTHCD